MPLVARKGRRAISVSAVPGHMDPGAASMSLLFDALATELCRLTATMVGIVVVSHSPRPGPCGRRARRCRWCVVQLPASRSRLAPQMIVLAPMQ